MQKKIALWSGASASEKKSLDAGLRRLKALGLDPFIPAQSKRYACKPLSRIQPYLAGPDSAKVQSLCLLLKSPRFSEILCMRGGFGTLRLLQSLDKNLKAKDIKIPKRLWGYSDISVIQCYLFERFKLPWVHSPMLTSDSFQQPNSQERQVWQKIQSPGIKTLSFALKASPQSQRLKRPASSALLLGGNLASLLSLWGTKWEPKWTRPYYLAIEEIAEEGRRLERLLLQLVHSKAFKNCEAVICGHFTRCGNHRPIIEAWAKDHKVPLYWGLAMGHEKASVPIPMGVKASLKVSGQKALLEVCKPQL